MSNGSTTKDSLYFCVFTTMNAMNRIFILIWICCIAPMVLFGQEKGSRVPQETESGQNNPGTFSPDKASEFILRFLGSRSISKSDEQDLRILLIRLVDQYHQPFDTIRSRLAEFPFDAQTSGDQTDEPPIDSLGTDEPGNPVAPRLQPPHAETSRQNQAALAASIRYDSLQKAVNILLDYILKRDSILIYIRDDQGGRIPFWITQGKEDLFRYWLKNDMNDSITVWIGNPEGTDISLLLEEGINLKRPEKYPADDIPITTLMPVRTPMKLKPLEEIPFSWKFSVISAMSLNQNHLSNWAKGGVSSFSSLIDLMAKADYVNKKTNERWFSNGRLRYGSIHSKDQGFRTSNDILEFNSQYNKVMRQKTDFSALLYMKTQIARGYKYPNDSVVVSKFLNPGTFTIGVGLEYKPFKHTSLNLSALSYKSTFVLDTAHINQTSHGIEAGKKVKKEFGGQLLIKNSMGLMDGLRMTHLVRLFSNYLEKPQNVDVDWEMGFEKEINWYFTIKLNLHLIYDDDIRFPVLDDAGEPVLWPDGTPRKSAKMQINQFLGLTLTFRI
jgi:hypothetical protein